MISALISYLQTPRSKNAREGRGRRDARPEVEGEEQEGAPSSKSGYVCACRCTCAVKSWHQRAQISQPSPWLKEGSQATPVRNKHPLQNLVSFPQLALESFSPRARFLKANTHRYTPHVDPRQHASRARTSSCLHSLLPPLRISKACRQPCTLLTPPPHTAHCRLSYYNSLRTSRISAHLHACRLAGTRTSLTRRCAERRARESHIYKHNGCPQ